MIKRLRLFRNLGLQWTAAAFLVAPAFLHAHGDLHVRIEDLSAEIRRKPDDANLHLQRGELHGLHGEWEAAEADFAKAQRLDPKLVTVFLARSRMMLARKSYREADIEVGRFLEVHPRHSAALIVRARALAGQKKFKESAKAWAKVIEEADRPDVEHYYERAQVLAASGPDQTDEALRTLDAGVAKLGKIPTLGLYAIQLEVARKRYDNAIQRLDVMMPKNGRKETWRELRGDILVSAGRHEEGRREFATALEEMKGLPQRVRSTKATSSLEERLKVKAAKGSD